METSHTHTQDVQKMEQINRTTVSGKITVDLNADLFCTRFESQSVHA